MIYSVATNVLYIPSLHYHCQPPWFQVQRKQHLEQEESPHSSEIVWHQGHNERSQNHEPANSDAYRIRIDVQSKWIENSGELFDFDRVQSQLSFTLATVFHIVTAEAVSVPPVVHRLDVAGEHKDQQWVELYKPKK